MGLRLAVLAVPTGQHGPGLDPRRPHPGQGVGRARPEHRIHVDAAGDRDVGAHPDRRSRQSQRGAGRQPLRAPVAARSPVDQTRHRRAGHGHPVPLAGAVSDSPPSVTSSTARADVVADQPVREGSRRGVQGTGPRVRRGGRSPRRPLVLDRGQTPASNTTQRHRGTNRTRVPGASRAGESRLASQSVTSCGAQDPPPARGRRGVDRRTTPLPAPRIRPAPEPAASRGVARAARPAGRRGRRSRARSRRTPRRTRRPRAWPLPRPGRRPTAARRGSGRVRRTGPGSRRGRRPRRDPRQGPRPRGDPAARRDPPLRRTGRSGRPERSPRQAGRRAGPGGPSAPTRARSRCPRSRPAAHVGRLRWNAWRPVCREMDEGLLAV